MLREGSLLRRGSPEPTSGARQPGFQLFPLGLLAVNFRPRKAEGDGEPCALAPRYLSPRPASEACLPPAGKEGGRGFGLRRAPGHRLRLAPGAGGGVLRTPASPTVPQRRPHPPPARQRRQRRRCRAGESRSPPRAVPAPAPRSRRLPRPRRLQERPRCCPQPLPSAVRPRGCPCDGRDSDPWGPSPGTATAGSPASAYGPTRECSPRVGPLSVGSRRPVSGRCPARCRGPWPVLTCSNHPRGGSVWGRGAGDESK